eukprot:jgi/Bigna1/137793/aug1.41_g12501
MDHTHDAEHSSNVIDGDFGKSSDVNVLDDVKGKKKEKGKEKEKEPDPVMMHEHHFEVPVCSDNTENGCRDSCSAWPFGICGFKMNEMEHVSDAKDAQFDTSELFDHLKKLQ